MARKPVKVLVIDDSAYNRQTITSMLSGVDGIEVVSRAPDGNEGLKQLMKHQPDVITLDLEMPKMDGFTFLRILMGRRPTPVIVISSHSARDSVYKAMELGALDFVGKPTRPVSPELRNIEHELVSKIKLIGCLKPVDLVVTQRRPAKPAPTASRRLRSAPPLNGLLCIAASTGGPPHLKRLFEELPNDMPIGILVTQHMPPTFTRKFAHRLNEAGGLEVRQAEDGDKLRGGLALIAPGDRSLLVHVRAGEICVALEAMDPRRPRSFVPSADRMMETAVEAMGSGVMGVVLTGMGNDGSIGIPAIRKGGGQTLAESEETAVIFGMPKAAIATGCVDEVVPLSEISMAIVRFANSRW